MWGLRPTSEAQNITRSPDQVFVFCFFVVTTVTKQKPARKADGRTFEYKKNSSLGRHNRIGDASGGDEAQGCEGLNSDAGDNSTESAESRV